MTTESLAEQSYAGWQGAAERELAAIETRLFIDGQFVDATLADFRSNHPCTSGTQNATSKCKQRNMNNRTVHSRP